ncbi:hypothetical protein EDD86DRAFT_234907 [Gorgonomyces haynaldii]|nr:hypothetical protein EDD86DRAFT_234907 [Gorgonomyces haynaldii]
MATQNQINENEEFQQQPNTPASLYVGDLEPSVTEANLFEVFNAIGPVASIRVCRDAVTRRSLGYGYVNYINMADAEKALEQLNYASIRGSAVRIMWSNRDPSIRKSGNGNIFIKNLDPAIDNKSLHDTFAAFGTILSCKVAADNAGRSKGYGFVHYETVEMAENAIAHVNGMLLNDRQVFAGFHISKKERESKLEEQRSKFTNIYVKNLDGSVDQKKFEELFTPFGKIVSIALAVDEDGKSKEFGFVNYENHQDAAAAVQEMNEKEIAGKQLYVGRAQKKSERENELRQQYEKVREEKLSKYQGVNLYVKNLDDAINDDTLREEFAPYGVITSAKVMIDDKTGLSKGFGFVCFSNPDEATKAVTEMNGRLIHNKPIYVALAQRKEARRAQLAAQIQQRNLRMQQMVPGMPNAYPGAPMFYPPARPGFYPGQPQLMARPGQFPPRPMGGPQQFPMVPQPYPVQQGGQRPPQQRPQQRPPAGGRGQGQPQSGRGRGGFKMVGNRPPVVHPAANVTAADLSKLPPADQKRFLGESLFPQIVPLTAHAGKITGMLLEMDNAELLHLLEDPEALKGKVEEAVEALEEHMRSQANE